MVLAGRMAGSGDSPAFGSLGLASAKVDVMLVSDCH